MIQPHYRFALRNPAFFLILGVLIAGCSRTPSDVPARESADWVRDAIVLEVSVRSFSVDGTLGSLTNRVEALRAFGASVLLLGPIHPIGDLNREGLLGNPYAAQDFYAVNPEFGTMEDFRALVDAVHRQGMKILIDMPASQAAWDSKLMFEHPEWFLKDESGAIVSPDARSSDVAGLNYNHHELRKYMIAAMEFWVRDVGIDGYRFAGAGNIPTDFWEIVRSQLEKIKPVMMISETAEPQHHMLAFDATVGWSSMNAMREILGGLAEPSQWAEAIANERNRFPAGSLHLRPLDLSGKSLQDSGALPKGGEALSLVAAASFLIPGIPLIQGVGEAGIVFSNEEPESGVTSLCKRLIALRAELPSLRRGDYVSLRNSREDVVTSFERRYEGHRAIVLLNWNADETSVAVSPEGSTSVWKEYLDGEVFSGDGRIEVRLKPFSFKVIVSEGHPL